MSVPQGSVEFNEGYGDEVVLRISFSASCGELQDVASQSLDSLTGTLNAVTSQYNQITAELTQIQQDATNLFNHIATFAGLQSATSALNVQLATAPAITADFGSILAYLNAQATAMVTVNTGSLGQMVQFLLQLNSDYATLQNDIANLEARVSTLAYQITAFPQTITQIKNALTTAAERFPSCIIPGV